MMESLLEERGVAPSTSGNEESEAGDAEQRYAGTSTSTNEESDTDSDEPDNEKGPPILTSKEEESAIVCSKHDSERKSREEESDSNTDKSSDDDTGTEDDRDDGDSSEDFFTEAVDQEMLAQKEEGKGNRKPNLQEEQSSHKVPDNKGIAAPSLGDDVVTEAMETAPNIAESSKQAQSNMAPNNSDLEGEILGGNEETPILLNEVKYQRDEASPESLKVPTPEEGEPSSFQMRVVRDGAPDLLESDGHGNEDSMTAEDEYVKKGFTCDGNTEEEDEELREYWTRALQTSTSTGEIVEEIVKVLKHRQKTHDLLCPVCGSCVTRRVILRKRKRSSFISVDRWYRDPLDEAEVQEQEVREAVEEPDREEYQDIEAFGCLSCFSLFFRKGRELLNQLQADIGPNTFNCLPFFFPPYPWGMTQLKPRSTELNEEPRADEVDESEEPIATDMRSSFTCGIGSALLPDYPWGTMPCLLKEEGSSLEVAEEAPLLDVQDSVSTDARPDFTCGIGSTLLPDYPWGTTHFLSPGKYSDQTEIAVEAGRSTQDVEQQREESVVEERTCSCGVAPAVLPAYPWGVCREQKRGLDDAGVVSQSVEGPQPESTCTCGIAQALFPDYRWGYLTKAEEVTLQSSSELEAGTIPSVHEDANLQSVSQLEISEEAPQLCREERNCTCGLVPALVPDYSWGFFGKDKDNEQKKIDTQAKTVQETEGKEAEDNKSSCDIVSAVLPNYPWGMTSESQEISEDVPILGEKRESEHTGIGFLQNGAHMRIGSAVLPSYPWGKCSVHQSIPEQNGRVQRHQDAADRDCTCGLGLTMLPKFPWGQTVSTAMNEQEPFVSRQEIKNYVEQETMIEARITSKTDVFTVTSTTTTYPGEKPPQNIKTMIPQETSHTIQHVKLDQTVTVINASVKVDEAAGIKGASLVSVPSTGFALLDLVEEGVGGKGRLETRPSTGYARLEEFAEEQELPISEIEEDPASLKYTSSEIKSDSTWQLVPETTYYKHEKTTPQTPSSGTQFPSFEWSVGKLDAGDLTTPLLKASIEPESETFISVLKPSPGGVDKPKTDNWLSVFKVSKPSDDAGLTAPLLSPASGYIEEIEEVKRPLSRPQVQVMTEAVIDVPPGDLGPSVGTTAVTVPALTDKKKKEADDWDILKSIVYGGLEISIASIGVTSSAAGGNAITRTVVYMGLATLFSGLIGFYHNVLNLYHHHKDHYVDIVGLSLALHGTVALISYIVFGLLSPLIYAFSYRETDNRDDKFMLCCGVTIVAVTALALGKAKVSNKRYLRTLFAYLLGGVLAAIVGYLTGEHVAELLEEWGI